MRKFIPCLAALLLILNVCLAGGEQTPIPGLGPTGPVKKLHTGFAFTEGPAPDHNGNVYFSDIPNKKIHKVDAAGKLTTFKELPKSSNGLMVSAKGEIVACEMGGGAVIAFSADGKERRVIADKYDGKQFNAPNDLVIDKQGGIYFTDPTFNAPKPLPQDKTCVYYVDTTGKVTRLVDDLKQPNGVRLSPDEKTLYVFPSGSSSMMSYPVESPGKIGAGKVFCKLKKGGADGAAVDSKGNLYITSSLGLEVFSPEGKALGVIAFPEQPANVAFGGKDLKTLYVTARKSLYTVPMEVKGHQYALPK